ncbi:hypothetical protein C475_14583 [Halosimplex carlsbadense 2-9-1]|uniref:Uncharacterized protein n=1 Tax=Halosimplex carlsbadense 2-9-1 TaxID=797114 RepID=M0CLM4_9EURY|nr:hypothetical protein C475_14583 [Halosimplex carlsbadense 2-9-1]
MYLVVADNSTNVSADAPAVFAIIVYLFRSVFWHILALLDDRKAGVFLVSDDFPNALLVLDVLAVHQFPRVVW